MLRASLYHDFTRCVKPNGEIFGTQGKCLSPNRAAPLKSKSKKKEVFLMMDGEKIPCPFKNPMSRVERRYAIECEEKLKRG